MEPLQCIYSVILKTRRDLYNRLTASKDSVQPSGWKVHFLTLAVLTPGTHTYAGDEGSRPSWERHTRFSAQSGDGKAVMRPTPEPLIPLFPVLRTAV